jgi:hypothetical protein
VAVQEAAQPVAVWLQIMQIVWRLFFRHLLALYLQQNALDLVIVVLYIEPFKLKLTFLVFAYLTCSCLKMNAAHAAFLACRGTVVVMPRLLRVCLNADGNHEFAQAWTLETVLWKLTEFETRLGCLVYPPTQELRALYSKPILQAHIEGAIKQMDNKDLVYAIPTKMFKLPDNEMDNDTAVNNLCRVVSTSLLHCKLYASLLCVCCQISIPLSRTHGHNFCKSSVISLLW